MENTLNIEFDDVYYSKPLIHENNGSTSLMTPHKARLRNFTYSGAMTIDFNIKYIVKNGDNYNR